VPLVGLCTGAFILHRAGLMAGYRCCVSWFHHDDFLVAFEGLEPVADRIFVVDRDRLTCSGGASLAHLAAHLVERHLGHAPAVKALRIMIIDGEPAGEAPQPGIPVAFSTRDPLVRKALNLIQQSLDAPPAIETLAGRLGVGRRKLERHFARALSLSPATAARGLRLAHARFLLEGRGRSLANIAAETGFCDASHLIRAFRDSEGLTPDAYRRRAREAVASTSR
jgi:transcriptional regulator GlxA family with amidase domain